MSELMYQINRFHGFLWASGGAVSDFLIHNIDECCWMKDAWPVKAQANGGRHYRGDNVDQNFDNYAIEYTFADGTKLFVTVEPFPAARTTLRVLLTVQRVRESYLPPPTLLLAAEFTATTPCLNNLWHGNIRTRKSQILIN